MTAPAQIPGARCEVRGHPLPIHPAPATTDHEKQTTNETSLG